MNTPPIRYDVWNARADLATSGWTLIRDDQELRVRVVLPYAGQYSSHYDPEWGGIVIILHATLRAWAGYTPRLDQIERAAKTND